MIATVLALAVTLETQLIAQIQARLDAITSGDKAVWARDLDQSAILMDEEGHVSTKAQFLAGLAPLPKSSTGSLRVTRPHFTRDGDVAVIAFIADEHETIFGQHFQAQFGMVDTYHRVGDRWLLLSDTQTRLPLDPPVVGLTATQAHARWAAGLRRHDSRRQTHGWPRGIETATDECDRRSTQCLLSRRSPRDVDLPRR